MCGIAGLYAYLDVAPAVDHGELARMRGADGSGDWVSADGRTGFTQRRPGADGAFVITFDGEIDNYRELRAELQAKGRVFRGDSDTEVLLQLYEDRGAAMVDGLRGTFALGLWDARQRRLLLARDPLGIKPLYYADDGWTLRFASRAKSLLAGGAVSREIRSLPAGTTLLVDGTGPDAPLNAQRMAGRMARSGGGVTTGARILALVSDCYGAQGGIARYNQDLFGALAADDAEILILPRLESAAGLTLPAGIRQVPPVFNSLIYSLAALRAAWRHRPIDVVFCGHVFMAPLARLLCRLFGAYFWVQAHGVDVWARRRRWVRWGIEAADMMTLVSRGTRRSLLEWVDLSPERARVLPNTVREVFAPGPPSEALRARLGLGPGPILLTVARLASVDRYKGHEEIFAALPALRARHPTLVHVVAGDGDDRARLEKRALELAHDPAAVRFLGYVPEEDLPDLYRLSDLFVMPSSEEGFGIVYLEAAACGLRVIGGVGGGSEDAIPDERVGVLVDRADGAALTAAVLRLLGQGRADLAALEPYRRPHFAAGARLLLARLRARPRRMKGEA